MNLTELSTQVSQVIQRTPTVKSFRFDIPAPAEFKPGHFLSITLEGEQALTRCLSISCSPTESGYLEVTKRITDSQFSKLLDQAEPGYEVSLKYPMGMFTFEGEFDKICLLSGGIGITPLRSITKYIVDKKLGTDVFLLYSNRTEEEIGFAEDFSQMQKTCPNLKVIYTLSRAGEDWSGRRGRIDASMLRNEVSDYAEREFFVCGPPPMVTSLVSMLKSELALAESKIKTETFRGYE